MTHFIIIFKEKYHIWKGNFLFIKSFVFMIRCWLLACFVAMILQPTLVSAQRIYKAHSVLSSGSFYKISVSRAGVYKIDIPFLSSLGISTSNLAAASVRLYGNGGQMLSEANNGSWVDDLQENAIQVVDGGDGIINGTDYLLFYATGPDQWLKDSANARFNHKKNLYSDKSYYYLTIGGTGKRVNTNQATATPTITVNSFSDRQFHELDTVNFLNSGREWYGEEFANIPGKTTTRDFIINFPGIVINTPVTFISQSVARSVGGASRFDTKINGQPTGQVLINPVSGSIYDVFAREATITNTTMASQTAITINYNFVPGGLNAQGWLNWFEVFARRSLSMNGVDQLQFRDWLSVGAANVANYIISNSTATTQVWDVTDPLNPVAQQVNFAGTDLRFVNSANRLHEYVAFNNTNFLQPANEGRVTTQDLHASSAADYIIITYAAFLQQAQRIARFHQQKNGYRAIVATTEQVFNEFGSGSPDPVAIRDFIKMYYDKYGASAADKPKYLLLLGDASFDYKNRVKNNTNFVPAWENNFSLDPLSSYTSDDFYGFLDDNEDINSGVITNYLDIGIGRVPAKNTEEANNFADKLYAYYASSSFGPWRNSLTFIADDEDQNLHLQDAEIFANTAAATAPVFNEQKIYLDAYQQQSGSGGSSYPQVNSAINNQIYNGTLIWNYNGHGGSNRLAEETVLDQSIVNSWNNAGKLPLFITATCDFAPYDNPLVNSLGENILLRSKTGGIAMMTTTRVVFAFSNKLINNNYLRFALQADANGHYKTLGDAIKEAKNYTYQTSSDITNNRKFTLLGDPAMTLAFPTQKARITQINGKPSNLADTLSAGENVTISGELTDVQGGLLSGFTGAVYPVIFDKPQTINTQANDVTSQVASFQVQNNILFKGKASVSNGKFSFSFKVPKDINYAFGNGKISLYAENGTLDANGNFSGFIVGGAGTGTGNDNKGPDIKPYLNDDRFVNGGITNETPVLFVKLADSSGINTAGTGVGHDIIATLDNDNSKFYVLNDFYTSDIDSYQKGFVKFQLPTLEKGTHSLKIKAWDVLNNSSEAVIEFTVIGDEVLAISHVLNYPNPFTTKTQFWFEHNKPGQPLQVRVQVFTVAGRLIKSIQKTIITAGNRSYELEWDARDEFGDKVARGIYLYKITVTAPDNQKLEKIERMVVF